MNKNAEAITLLCSHLCVAENIKPLEPKEWSDLAECLMAQKIQPGDLLDFGLTDLMRELSYTEEEAARLMRLIDRGGSMRFELAKYEDAGIQVITRADTAYPKQLKHALGNTCPPLFYYAGDLNLLKNPSVGYVGSREIAPDDLTFTKQTVAKTAGRGYAVVSGGAKGIDSISAAAAISEGANVIEYLSDAMMRKMRDSELVRTIRDGRMLLMSVVVPTAGFNVGVAMMRNRYIYAQSSGTVVIRADKGKGGTWAGATENIKKGWCPTFCRDADYPGNQALIAMGAIPVSADWDGNVEANIPPKKTETATVQQMSLFDL